MYKIAVDGVVYGDEKSSVVGIQIDELGYAYVKITKKLFNLLIRNNANDFT